MHGSDGVPGAVHPQPLEHPCGGDDGRGPAGGLPLVGHGGADGGTQPHQSAQEGHDLQAGHGAEETEARPAARRDGLGSNASG